MFRRWSARYCLSNAISSGSFRLLWLLVPGPRNLIIMSASDKIDLTQYDAALFDLDGVLTNTATVHSAAWKEMFDEYLQQRAAKRGEVFSPFSIEEDYHEYVDGKPRYDGVRDFLSARGIQLPHGTPEDEPAKETVCGLGNRKDRLVNKIMERDGIEVFPGSLRFLEAAKAAGLKLAVVSSSCNCLAVIRNGKIESFFQERVDGNTAAEENLPGKPQPDTFLKAAERLGVTPSKSMLLEDAIVGVQAGERGAFGLVIGVARRDNIQALRDNGAHVVVTDLADLL